MVALWSLLFKIVSLLGYFKAVALPFKMSANPEAAKIPSADSFQVSQFSSFPLKAFSSVALCLANSQSPGTLVVSMALRKALLFSYCVANMTRQVSAMVLATESASPPPRVGLTVEIGPGS